MQGAKRFASHGLNERVPVTSFYEGLDHVYALVVELGGVAPTAKP